MRNRSSMGVESRGGPGSRTDFDSESSGDPRVRPTEDVDRIDPLLAEKLSRSVAPSTGGADDVDGLIGRQFGGDLGDGLQRGETATTDVGFEVFVEFSDVEQNATVSQRTSEFCDPDTWHRGVHVLETTARTTPDNPIIGLSADRRGSQ